MVPDCYTYIVPLLNLIKSGLDDFVRVLPCRYGRLKGFRCYLYTLPYEGMMLRIISPLLAGGVVGTPFSHAICYVGIFGIP